MNVAQVAVRRPQRWDTPFDEAMTDELVDRLLSQPPFSLIDEGAFPKSLPLRGILKNDCRIREFSAGEIIIRQGDYGHSAFFVLEGAATVSLASLPSEVLGRQRSQPKTWWSSLNQLWKNSHVAEARESLGAPPTHTQLRQQGEETRVFLQDVPGFLDSNQTATVNVGELFGEISALTRTPRSATILATEPCRLLELRWQGFRDILRRDPALKKHVEQLYRQHSLRTHLCQTPFLSDFPSSIVDQLVDLTQFESYGNFEWTQKFKKIEIKDVAERIQEEPLIVEQGQSIDGLLLIRNGFARLSRQHGEGHQTIAYLGKGESFGLRELVHQFQTESVQPALLSLRAVGYVDILKIPLEAVKTLILPHLPTAHRPPPIVTERPIEAERPERRQAIRDEELDSSLLEFLVEGRYINGTQAMLIDLNRCTRCDDCVRACAATHDNNPRFLRAGRQHDHWMVAGACMHCVDPVCMIGCPTGAIGRDETTGHVVINDQTCIGCSTCANSCPYDNIRMVDIRDRHGNPLIDEQSQKPIQKATKCDLCSEQLGGPACQRACPHDALTRVDLTTTVPLLQMNQR